MDLKGNREPVTNLKRTGYGGFMPGWLLGGVALVIVLVLIAFFASCSNPEPAPGADVTAGKIIENPNSYVGKTVTVSGEVERVLGPKAFVMDSGVNIGELLVVGADPFPQVPDGGNRGYVINDTATVTGTVRMLVTADVEREIGWDLTPELKVEFNAKPVLIVQKAGFKPNPNRSQTTATPANNANSNTDASADPITDLLIIVTPVDRAPLVGRRVRFTDVKVRSVVGDRGFFIGPSDSQRLFARLTKPLDTGRAEDIVNVNQGQVRTLSGIIKRLPTTDEVRQQWGLNAQEAAALEPDGVYLEVDTIELLRKKP